VQCCGLSTRGDLPEAVGQRHGGGAAAGSALEGSALAAGLQQPRRHAGLPGVDPGAGLHPAQTPGPHWVGGWEGVCVKVVKVVEIKYEG